MMIQLPYGIEEQYQLFHTFIQNPYHFALNIEYPFPETAAILQVALQELDPSDVSIQYFESDTCSKRILTHRRSGHTKRIVVSKHYESGWVWKNYPTCTMSIRPGF